MVGYRLILKSGTGKGTEYPLEKNELFLGRELSNDIVVNDIEVSRRHARLILAGNTYMIEDLGSTNGTFIGGQRISSFISLRPGEIITIGKKVILKFDLVGVDSKDILTEVRGPALQTRQLVIPIDGKKNGLVSEKDFPDTSQSMDQPSTQSGVILTDEVATPPDLPAIPVEKKKKNPTWLIWAVILLAFLLVFCLLPLIIILITGSYCLIFPGLFNYFTPGICP